LGSAEPWPERTTVLDLFGESGWEVGFDQSERHEDLLSRRISQAELSTVNVAMAYAVSKRPGAGMGDLFREKAPGKGAGPLGELAEIAYEQGYRQREEASPPSIAARFIRS
jgi:hypothetical protein